MYMDEEKVGESTVEETEPEEEALIEEAEEEPEETLEEAEEEEAEEAEYDWLPEGVEVVEERVYTVPLWKVIRYKKGLHRAKRAAKFLRDFVSRHMKNPNVKISPEVNEVIWSRGIRNPPRRIKVKVIRTSEEEIWVLKHE